MTCDAYTALESLDPKDPQPLPQSVDLSRQWELQTQLLDKVAEFALIYLYMDPIESAHETRSSTFSQL